MKEFAKIKVEFFIFATFKWAVFPYRLTLESITEENRKQEKKFLPSLTSLTRKSNTLLTVQV